MHSVFSKHYSKNQNPQPEKVRDYSFPDTVNFIWQRFLLKIHGPKLIYSITSSHKINTLKYKILITHIVSVEK